jgi:hypothetical protein
MKFLILILVLAISAQPLQAGFCDMDMDMEKSQETSHHMDHSDDDGHDCCDKNDTDSQEGCGSEMNCGPCFVSVSTLPGLMKVNPVWGHQHYQNLSSDVVLPSHSSPPFRPPIS